jgi:predicted transcriptional regulator
MTPDHANDNPSDQRRGQIPAVPIHASVQAHFLICLEDGKPMKMMKRYLRIHYGLTPEEYRAKWGLPPDYPMVAPAYAEQKATAWKLMLSAMPSRPLA